jgi:hypothetical protein
MSDPATTDKFWTFLIKGMSFAGNQASATGWFVFVTITVAEPSDITATSPKRMDLQYLTPPDQPVSLDLTQFIPETVTMQDISPKAIMDYLTQLFSSPFKQIPKAPIDLPMHRIPPSQRRKMEEQLRAPKRDP